jgi:hypothetical protein
MSTVRLGGGGEEGGGGEREIERWAGKGKRGRRVGEKKGGIEGQRERESE